MKQIRFVFAICAGLILQSIAIAQVNSGSNGSDGEFHPTQNTQIDMSDHPNGIYQYTSVNIPTGVGVTFTPNANNTPVVWLVQGSCVVSGFIDLNGQTPIRDSAIGGGGAVGGFKGGNGGAAASAGQGPGGGSAGGNDGPGNASFGTLGLGPVNLVGQIYGNKYLLPLIGGSGGGGRLFSTPPAAAGGGGGGGAILIAASQLIEVTGQIFAGGGQGAPVSGYLGPVGGGGSGGGVRLFSSRILGSGAILAQGGSGFSGPAGGDGRVRFDVLENNFGGTVTGVFTQGFQPIIIPAPNQGVQLAIQSVAGNAVPTNPSGVLANPDVIISAQQPNPIPVVVKCTNVPLNSEITVVVHPANGPDVQAVGTNTSGTAESSTATISLNMPRGGGIIYARTVTGINGGNQAASAKEKGSKGLSYSETGLTAYSERFSKIETKAVLGGKQETTFITASGKRYQLPK